MFISSKIIYRTHRGSCLFRIRNCETKILNRMPMKQAATVMVAPGCIASSKCPFLCMGNPRPHLHVAFDSMDPPSSTSQAAPLSVQPFLGISPCIQQTDTQRDRQTYHANIVTTDRIFVLRISRRPDNSKTSRIATIGVQQKLQTTSNYHVLYLIRSNLGQRPK